MKKAFRAFCSLYAVRSVTRGYLAINGFFGKVFSNLKYRALVKNCNDSICHWTTEIKFGHNLYVGNNTRIGPNCTIGARSKIVIGENVTVSKYVVIETAGLDLNSENPRLMHQSKPITIGDEVWIGTHCIILGGVTIGKKAVIGAGTLVSKDVPPYAIVVGSPNRILQNKYLRDILYA
jgi:maltose O-acetyltransferase